MEVVGVTEERASMDTVVPDAKFLRGVFVGLLIIAGLSVTGLLYTIIMVPIPPLSD